jgi:uncharacterized membrane protein
MVGVSSEKGLDVVEIVIGIYIAIPILIAVWGATIAIRARWEARRGGKVRIYSGGSSATGSGSDNGYSGHGYSGHGYSGWDCGGSSGGDGGGSC